MSAPLILLSNDDGYLSRGIRAIRDALSRVAEVVVCAPESEQSSTSHAISLHRPLRLVERGTSVFSVDGTPADCVYVALNSGTRVLPRKPDLVVSGLNHGLNLANDVFYSGTVAAAREGALRGIHALAVSAADGTDFAAAASTTADLALKLIHLESPHTLLFNVNYPRGAEWSLRPTKLGSRTYQDSVDFRRDPRGGEYLWIGGSSVRHSGDVGSDTEAHDAGDVGVTPLALGLWDASQMQLARNLLDSPGALEPGEVL
jgi:5'-nucleotidase